MMCEGDRMVCEGDGMVYEGEGISYEGDTMHILACLLENRRKTWCLMYEWVVPARRLVYVHN